VRSTGLHVTVIEEACPAKLAESDLGRRELRVYEVDIDLRPAMMAIDW
jgi:hypothetical protein